MARPPRATFVPFLVLGLLPAEALAQACADRGPSRLQVAADFMYAAPTAFAGVTGSGAVGPVAAEGSLRWAGDGLTFAEAGAAWTFRGGPREQTCLGVRFADGGFEGRGLRRDLEVREISALVGQRLAIAREEYGAVDQFIQLGLTLVQGMEVGEGIPSGELRGDWGPGFTAASGFIVSGSSFEVVLGGRFLSNHEAHDLRLVFQLRLPTSWRPGATDGDEDGRGGMWRW